MRISDWSSDVCSSDLAILPLNRLRRTKLVALSGIWPKSLPDALLGRSRRPSGTQIPLEQRVDDLEHFAEVSFHLPEFQCGEETRAAKAVNQARPDGHGLEDRKSTRLNPSHKCATR